jgi:hypothetical protein
MNQLFHLNVICLDNQSRLCRKEAFTAPGMKGFGWNHIDLMTILFQMRDGGLSFFERYRLGEG